MASPYASVATQLTRELPAAVSILVSGRYWHDAQAEVSR
ncbi:hypothetical protein PR003_g27355 [Phytophthora rubi]|uniref:Uncharacterized protein n=1 Tax=Phytophthora rubi TaxID=129364 RepID=A0A6A3H3H4_9STRA|nr:hypothetical protein PR001_g29174 [Phytophthora rubi]KAE9282633.1 hypothetical protein PR003_g27355 [Phytophthora rubi]